MIPNRQNQQPITLSTRSHVRLLTAPWPWLTANATFDDDDDDDGGDDDDEDEDDDDDEEEEEEEDADKDIEDEVVRAVVGVMSTTEEEVSGGEGAERAWAWRRLLLMALRSWSSRRRASRMAANFSRMRWLMRSRIE
jgi:hypothetical protein